MVGQLLNRSAQEKSSREFTAGSFIDIKLFLLPKSLNNFEFYFLIDIAPEVGGPRIIMIKKNWIQNNSNLQSELYVACDNRTVVVARCRHGGFLPSKPDMNVKSQTTVNISIKIALRF